MPDLDIRRPPVLCAVGNIEVCGEGRLVDDCGDGTDGQSTMINRPTDSPRSCSPSSVPFVYEPRYMASVHTW